jgi:hypothetical protein
VNPARRVGRQSSQGIDDLMGVGKHGNPAALPAILQPCGKVRRVASDVDGVTE